MYAASGDTKQGIYTFKMELGNGLEGWKGVTRIAHFFGGESVRFMSPLFG